MRVGAVGEAMRGRLTHLLWRGTFEVGSCTSLLREGVGVGRRSVVEVGHRWELQGWLVCAEGDMSTAWWPRELLSRVHS